MDPGQVSVAWAQGEPYQRYMGRWSALVARQFVPWLQRPAGSRWLDVGCGTGMLCAAILDADADASLIGVDPSAGFLDTARARLGARVRWLQGDAASIPLADGCVDVVVSGLVLNFVADLPAALAEMSRVCAPGGTVAAYVWDYTDKMDLMRRFWDVAIELDPDVADMKELKRYPQCRPAPLRQLFEQAGLAAVAVTGIDIHTPFDSFDDYWAPFLGGQGAAPSYVVGLAEPQRAALRDTLRQRITSAPDGSIPMSARAWAIRATVAK